MSLCYREIAAQLDRRVSNGLHYRNFNSRFLADENNGQ